MVDIKEDILLVDCVEAVVSDDQSYISDFPLMEESSNSISYEVGDDMEDILEMANEIIKDEEMYCPDLSNIQSSFIYHIKEEEIQKFGKSFVEQIFCRYKCPIEDIIAKNRTELWLDNCIYGLQFQAFLCRNLNLSIPVVPQRNRKCSSKKSQIKEKYEDPILEQLMFYSPNFPQTNNVQRRLAPRDQISLLIFLMDLLCHPYFQDCIRWKDKKTLTFEITKPKAVAYFWMVVKDNGKCSFENFTRAIRFKRNAGVFKHIDHKKRRVYQFHQRALREYRCKRQPNSLTSAFIKTLGEA